MDPPRVYAGGKELGQEKGAGRYRENSGYREWGMGHGAAIAEKPRGRSHRGRTSSYTQGSREPAGAPRGQVA